MFLFKLLSGGNPLSRLQVYSFKTRDKQDIHVFASLSSDNVSDAGVALVVAMRMDPKIAAIVVGAAEAYNNHEVKTILDLRSDPPR